MLPVLVAEVAVKSCEVGSGSACSSCSWFSLSRVSVMMGCMELTSVPEPVSSEWGFSSGQSAVGSVAGPRQSAARTDSLEDATASPF